MRSSVAWRRRTLILGGRRLFGARPGRRLPFVGRRLLRRLRGSRQRADVGSLVPGAYNCCEGAGHPRGLGGHSLCGLVWSPRVELFASVPSAERLRSRPSVAGYFSFSYLLHRLIEGYNLILTPFEGRFGLVVGPDVLVFFEFFEHALVLLDGQDDAHALAAFVHDVAGFHQFASLSLWSGLSERPASLFMISIRSSASSSSKACRISRLSSPRSRCQSVVE